MMVMLLVTALASVVVLATGIVADPSNHRRSQPHSLSITKHIDPQGKYYPVQRDWSRFTHLMNKADRVSFSNLAEKAAEETELPLTNSGPCYEAKIGVGVPPTYCKSCVDFLSGMVFYIGHSDRLIVDTGSSNTWVGANAPYVKTNTSVNTSDLVVSISSYPISGPAQTKNLYQGVQYGSALFAGKFDFS
jgi:cathepsin E